MNVRGLAMEHKTIGEHTIPIVYATDQNYLFYTCVSMVSLAQNAKKETFYRIYILVDSKFNDSEKIFEYLEKIYRNISITIITVDEELFSQVYIWNQHISKAAFYRLAVCNYVEEDKCIYLDSDTAVTEDLSPLWNLNISDFYLGGCRDIWIDRMTPEDREKRRIETNIPSMDEYINSGVLLFNLNKIREEQLDKKFIEELKHQYRYEDQDILNVCCYGKILRLETKWNSFTAAIGYDTELYASGVPRSTVDEFKEMKGIIHYINADNRPWKGFRAWENWYWWNMASTLAEFAGYQQLYESVKNSEETLHWKKIVSKLRIYEQIIIWGYTPYALELFDWLLQSDVKAEIYFCDSNDDKVGKVYKNSRVISSEQAFQRKDNCVYVIASQRYGQEIKEKLIASKIRNKDILIYRKKNVIYYKMLDTKFYKEEIDEIFLKENICVEDNNKMVELKNHKEWHQKYFLGQWIFKNM